MGFPSSAIFAFNANVDHVRFANEEDIAKIDGFSPSLGSAISECFSYGVQKEMAIDAKACGFFLSKMEFGRKIVGGQAGNAVQQASALGVKCFLHTNFANNELLGLFSRPELVMVAGEKGFLPANRFASEAASAHHFVFESRENRTRFIASYDPLPLHPEDNFCHNITSELPGTAKAFASGFHLVKTPERLHKFAEELRRWKETSPKLQIFAELGDFQSKEVLRATEKEIFPLADMVGMNEVEAAQLSCDLEELPNVVPSVLFHSPQEQLVLPSAKLDAAALEFARRCASFKAANGRFAAESDLAGFSPSFLESPAETIGLGDAFSCAYFMRTP